MSDGSAFERTLEHHPGVSDVMKLHARLLQAGEHFIAEGLTKFLNGERAMSEEFIVKDSGKREEFPGGMVRDTQDGKPDFSRIIDGPMFDRWAIHLTKGATKYPDVKPGMANWMLANGEAELLRFQKSAFRHFRQWLRGDRDEDHAAAVFFNINGAEYVRGKLQEMK